ncbi:MAG: TIGR04283 family arsenosugar biosynthesis glycosyltransferase [Elusimicrobiota bacterium]
MKISVIIPTRNEEENISQAISRIRQTSDCNGIEIIVADGNSTDRTVELTQGIADKVIRVPQPGRAFQMQEGARVASGNLLLFLHADTRLPADWKEQLAQAWSRSEKPAATAFKLGFDSKKPFYRLLAWTANLRTALTGVPLGDQAIAVSREVFLRAGGFPPVPLMEEYLLCRKLKSLGRVVILPGKVATSVRRYERNGKLFNALRNAAITVLFYLGVPPCSLARLYR